MHDAYQEHLLDATDVCQSCLRQIRVRRIDPYRSNDLEAAATLSRKKQNTEIGYGPSESVTEQKGTFCSECGTESAFDRTWESVDFHDPDGPYGFEHFKSLCQNAMRSLEEAGVSIDRHAFATTALSRYQDGHGIDHCLGEATEHAIVSAAMDSANERQPARAD
jgi:hypothetical protein